jgi:hypothetical protein
VFHKRFIRSANAGSFFVTPSKSAKNACLPTVTAISKYPGEKTLARMPEKESP